jgi:putative DNA primase/helicase
LVGDNHEPQEFSTWSPKAIASIGKLSGTLRDRAIILPMKRKKPGERVVKLRGRDTEQFLELRRKARRWADDNVDALKKARPSIPEALNDRAADNWELLLAIAGSGGQRLVKLGADRRLET